MVRLDLGCDVVVAAGLDHVRIQGSLDQKAHVPQLRRLFLEDADEFLADDLPLPFRVGDARELPDEALLHLHVHERHVEVAVERRDDLLRLALSHQAVVDEDARQLVTDGFVHEQRGDGRVDAAGERAQDLLAPDLRANAVDLLLDHRCGRPG